MNRSLLLAPLLVTSFALAPSLSAEEPAKERIKIASLDRKKLESRQLPNFVEQVEEGFTLRDQMGREMQALLVSAHGETVKIQRIDDERQFDVPISVFDSETENMIRDWIDNDPEAVEYSLEISAARELIDSSEFEIAGRSLKTSDWTFRVTLTNHTRNELRDAQIEYRVVFDDRVEFSRTAVMPGKGPDQQDGQAVDLPPMAFNDEIEFTVPAVEVHTYEYVPTRGERDFIKDEIKGIWVRVVRRGEVIAEHKTNAPAMAGISWDNEDEIEIKITNKFRDSFTETEE